MIRPCDGKSCRRFDATLFVSDDGLLLRLIYEDGIPVDLAFLITECQHGVRKGTDVPFRRIWTRLMRDDAMNVSITLPLTVSSQCALRGVRFTYPFSRSKNCSWGARLSPSHPIRWRCIRSLRSLMRRSLSLASAIDLDV